uniref:Putative secreted protein n=1 Tax=Ixodes ricinus TaxID=34613 RepID=A0A6B0U2J7_IXORI
MPWNKMCICKVFLPCVSACGVSGCHVCHRLWDIARIGKISYPSAFQCAPSHSRPDKRLGQIAQNCQMSRPCVFECELHTLGFERKPPNRKYT